MTTMTDEIRFYPELEKISLDFEKASREMRYFLNPANGPDIQRRNWRRLRVGLPPLQEHYPTVYRRELEKVLTQLHQKKHD